MADEVRIEERLLNDAVDLVKPGGEYESRLLYHLICQMQEMGYRHRANYRIVLFTDNCEADFDEEYAHYLDKKASRESVSWDDENKEIVFENKENKEE